MQTLTRDDLERAARRYFSQLAEEVHAPRDIPNEDWANEIDFQLEESRLRIDDLEGQLTTNRFDEAVQSGARAMLGGPGDELGMATEKIRLAALQLAARAQRQQWRLYAHHLTAPWQAFSPDDDIFSRQAEPVASVVEKPVFHLDLTKPSTAKDLMTLGTAADDYSARREALQLGASAIQETARALGWLQEQVGASRPLGLITTDDMRSFRNDLAKIDVRHRGREAKLADRLTDEAQHQVKSVTAKKYWTSVQGFFEWAVEEQLITNSPASGIKLARKRGETRASPKPFERAEIERFFSTPLYQGHAGPKRLLDPGTDVSRGGKWWAGVLPFFTALRAGELAQLLPEDFVFDAEVPHLKVREEDDAGNKVKSAKTRSSIRDVPLSPVLLKLGLREFVERRERTAPSQRVFIEFRLGTGGRKSEGMTRFWGDYLKSNQIWRPGRATHVWRHTVASFLRASGVSDEEIGAVFGHAGRTVTSTYGDAMPLARKAEIVGRLEYGLDFVSLLGGAYDPRVHGSTHTAR